MNYLVLINSNVIQRLSIILILLREKWHPQDLNDSPLKFILSTSDDSDYICKYINTEHKQLTLYNKNNSSIVIEIFIPNDNKILLTIMNTEAFGNFS